MTPPFIRTLPRLHPAAAAALLLWLASDAAFAASPPDAGSLLQEVRPPVVPAPRQQAPALQLDSAPAAASPASAPFEVRQIRITGNTAFDTATLAALVQDLPGRRLTLGQLDEGASRITRHYQAKGYPLARAIIPAQTITNGEVTIQVVEARYGEIRLNNRTQVGDALLRATLSPLRPGDPVMEKDLDRALLLLSDIPEVSVSSVVKPGTEVGTSDLDIDAVRSPAVIGNVALDNFGNRYVGRARLSGAASIYNPFHHGDALSFGGITTGDGMNYGRIAYESLLSGAGTRAGAAYSKVRYELGGGIAALDAHGTADVASVWLRQPLLRGRQSNVYAQLQYDAKKLEDRIGTSGINTDRHLDNWVLSLNGDTRDSLLGGAASAWGLAWTAGRVRFDDAAAEASDAASARSRGSFSKWNANASRLQGLGRNSSVFLSLAAQWANSNLDSAEKMTVGGPYSVRAYDVGAAAGDTGSAITAEFRQELGATAGGQLQAIAFIDSAHVRVNRQPWVAGGNSATLSGAGVGVNWINASLWKLSASVATRLGSAPALVARSGATRAWVVASRSF